MQNTSIALPDEFIEDTILLIRGKRVILDHDLARLYGVTTKVLNQAVKRNFDRFPEDFMFQLTKVETEQCQRLKRSRSQIVTLKKTRGTNIKYQPYAFTEHGILMLSSVLNSQRAVQVNIQIMRTFVRLRQMLASNDSLIERLEELEIKLVPVEINLVLVQFKLAASRFKLEFLQVCREFRNSS